MNTLSEYNYFEGSAGGAIWSSGSEITTYIQGCVFVENTSLGYGGAIWGNEALEIRECLFLGNKARHGAGVYLGSSPIVVNCTFFKNEVIDGPGACIEAWSDYWQPTNPRQCIIAKTINGWGVECNYVKSFECCDFWMNERGDTMGMWCDISQDLGNFSADPLFCDEDGGDFGLVEGSPCLPGQHGPVQCGLVGARGAGCTGTATKGVTWGQLRALFR
jgi:hypothetical protein